MMRAMRSCGGISIEDIALHRRMTYLGLFRQLVHDVCMWGGIGWDETNTAGAGDARLVMGGWGCCR